MQRSFSRSLSINLKETGINFNTDRNTRVISWSEVVEHSITFQKLLLYWNSELIISVVLMVTSDGLMAQVRNTGLLKMPRFTVEVSWPFRWRGSQHKYLLYLVDNPEVCECGVKGYLLSYIIIITKLLWLTCRFKYQRTQWRAAYSSLRWRVAFKLLSTAYCHYSVVNTKGKFT